MVKSPIRRQTNSNPFSKVVFLFGPTGVGKTQLISSLDPSRFSVVNADSIQVYRGLDIGSAKATKEERARIRHYLVDVEDPWKQFTVARFIELADEACAEIAKEGKTPVLCGGTAYYFKHFLYGLSEAPASDDGTRLRIAREVEENGLPWAYERLLEVDPQSAGRIKERDSYRITRALEVWETSGRPLSSFLPSTTPRYGMKPLCVGLCRDNDELSDRIGERVGEMFRQGLLEEVRRLVREGATAEWPGMQGIGYREFFDAMRYGEDSLQSIKERIVRASRMYAKRQMTFFRSFAEVIWISPTEKAAFARLLDEFLA